MTLDSIQTVESARQILLEIVAEHLTFFPHRNGMLVAVLGAELSKRGLRGIHHKFGSEKLADFVRDQCQPPLTIVRAPSGADFLVGLAISAPRVTSRPAVTTGSWETVDPRVWKAVLSNQAPVTFIGPERQVSVGEMPSGEGWKQVPIMPAQEQGELLDEVRVSLTEVIGNEEVRNAIISALEKAKLSDAPILEFSNTMTAIYRSGQNWNRRRIDSVFSHVADSTGIDLRGRGTVRYANASVPPERKHAAVEALPLERAAPAAPMAQTAPPNDEATELRSMVKDAVDVMSLHDLLEIRLPTGAIHSVLRRRTGWGA